MLSWDHTCMRGPNRIHGRGSEHGLTGARNVTEVCSALLCNDMCRACLGHHNPVLTSALGNASCRHAFVLCMHAPTEAKSKSNSNPMRLD